MRMQEQNPAGGGWMERLVRMIGFKPQQAGLVKLLMLAVAIGILLMNAGALFGLSGEERRPPAAVEVAAPAGAPQDELTRMERDIAANLERTLSLIQGAGQVRVTVMLAAGPTVQPVIDTKVDKSVTKETAADKSMRETVSTNTTSTNVMAKSSGGDALAVMKKSRAQVAGVLIVAEGARSTAVRARLHEAAVTALGISANRIDVVPAGGGRS